MFLPAVRQRGVIPEDFQDKIIKGVTAAMLESAPPCLLRAPTASGKTLMLGRIAEHLGEPLQMMWFWFVPYGFLVAQTVGSLFDNCPGIIRSSCQANDVATISRVTYSLPRHKRSPQPTKNPEKSFKSTTSACRTSKGSSCAPKAAHSPEWHDGPFRLSDVNASSAHLCAAP